MARLENSLNAVLATGLILLAAAFGMVAIGETLGTSLGIALIGLGTMLKPFAAIIAGIGVVVLVDQYLGRWAAAIAAVIGLVLLWRLLFAV